MQIKFINSNEAEEILYHAYEHFKNVLPNQNLDLIMIRFCQLLCDEKKYEAELSSDLHNFKILKNLLSSENIDKRISNINSLIRDKYQNGYFGNNLLTIFIDNDFWICNWDNRNDLVKLILEFLEEIEPLEFFSNEKIFQPEKVLDLNSLEIINSLDIPLKNLLIEQNNNKILENEWHIDFEIIFQVNGSEWEENRENCDHIAYKILDLYGIELKGDLLKYKSEFKELNGFDINPLSENLGELLETKTEEYFKKLLLSEAWEELRYSFSELIGLNGYKLVIKNVNLKDSEKLIKNNP